MRAEAGAVAAPALPPPADRVRPGRQDPAWVRWSLITLVLALVGALIVVPIVNVFVEALAEGPGRYWNNLVADPDTRHSMLLTLGVVPLAVVANVVFGVAAAWTLSRFDFPGRTLLTALIDLPFSVSPVVAGLMFVLIFGLQGYFGPFLREDGYSIIPYVISSLGALAAAIAGVLLRPDAPPAQRGVWRHPWPVPLAAAAGVFALLLFVQLQLEVWPRHESLKIIFAFPGLVLATSFVTMPFVARELLPVMNAIGPDEELAALSLGASGWQMFWHVTVPNVKWGLFYGVVLCSARAIGEFGAVYVVSGHIAGKTDTMPLRIEKLFQEYNLPGSFAVASVLTLVALLTLVVKGRLQGHVRSPGGKTDPGEGGAQA